MVPTYLVSHSTHNTYLSYLGVCKHSFWGDSFTTILCVYFTDPLLTYCLAPPQHENIITHVDLRTSSLMCISQTLMQRSFVTLILDTLQIADRIEEQLCREKRDFHQKFNPSFAPAFFVI